MKYKLHMILEREGAILTIDDVIDSPDLKAYAFEHDLEAYTVIELDLKVIK